MEEEIKELLKDAVVVICDDKDADEIHMKRAVEIFSFVGMKIVFMNAKSHDHHVGLISHLPHAISYALVNSVLKEENRRNIINLAGGSLLAIERQIEFNNAANNESGVEVFEPVEQPANEETPVKNKNIDEKLQNVLDNFLNEDIKKEYNSSRKDAINVREKLEAACKEAGINDFRNAWKALHQYVGDEGHH